MGSGDVKEENERLKDEIIKLKEEQRQHENEKIDLSPQEIQKMMEENYELKDKCKQLEKNYLILENENKQLKNYSAMMQLNLQTTMQKMSYNQNLQAFNYFQNRSKMYKNQINNIINQNNNFARRTMINNNNFQNNNIITLIFNLDNKKKYPIVTLPEYRLGNIFLLLLGQIDDPNYTNIYNLSFFYMSQNITNFFLNNEQVMKLNLNSFNPTIDICLSKNI